MPKRAFGFRPGGINMIFMQYMMLYASIYGYGTLVSKESLWYASLSAPKAACVSTGSKDCVGTQSTGIGESGFTRCAIQKELNTVIL